MASSLNYHEELISSFYVKLLTDNKFLVFCFLLGRGNLRIRQFISRRNMARVTRTQWH